MLSLKVKNEPLFFGREKRENTLTWALRPLKYHTIQHVMEFLRVSGYFKGRPQKCGFWHFLPFWK